MNKFYKTVFISSMAGVLATSLIILTVLKCAKRKKHKCSDNCFDYCCDPGDTSDCKQNEEKKEYNM